MSETTAEYGFSDAADMNVARQLIQTLNEEDINTFQGAAEALENERGEH